MAVYPKATLNLRTKDANLETKTFSVSYVNPAATDANLKQLAVKLTALTNNTLETVYKTVQTDITQAEVV